MEKIAAAITRAIRSKNANLMTVANFGDYDVCTDIDPQETPIIWFDLMKRDFTALRVRFSIQIKGGLWRVLFNNFESGSFDHRFMLAISDNKTSGLTTADYTKKIADKIVEEFNAHFAA